MRKISALFLVVLAILFSASIAFAGSADARIANYGQGISQVVGVADVSAGNTIEVDADGSASVKEYPKQVAVNGGDADAKVSGACTVYGIVVTGVSAGDNSLIYDALTATGTPKFDIYVGTAADTKVITLPTGGISFATGVTVDATDGDVTTTLIYDN